MAKVICNAKDCVNRSERNLRKFRQKDGSPCHGCLLDYVTLNVCGSSDGGDVVCCSNYEKFLGIEEELKNCTKTNTKELDDRLNKELELYLRNKDPFYFS